MAEHVGIFGGRIPAEVETLSKDLKDLDKELFRKILKVVVSAVEGKDCGEAMVEIGESGSLSEEKLSRIVSGLFKLLREALRFPGSSVKQEGFKEDLRELRISEEFIADIASVVFGNSSLARALQPSVLMQLKLSDGNIHRFEVPVSKFQELRYNVALILKEMNDLEKRSILKIQG
ncbi:COMM domain-containing protein 5 isoform X2 [Astyanax mexicanus]|uniref:COMM domain-containing protein 5 isoform X2 n=1 Tax=Astyanax mexicanus TaxID=7994 RepID=UPI0020CB3E27|nr:COMM domain-containing protein 5 isoform X2 [Astyanax mexicanus]